MSLLPFDGIATLVNTVLTRVFPDKSEALKQQFDLAMQESKLASDAMTAQVEVNKVEAASEHWIAANWRPLLGFFCALSFGWTYLIQPMATYFIVVSGYSNPALPVLNMDQMMPVLLGMLGLGSMRSYERVKGVIK